MAFGLDFSLIALIGIMQFVASNYS